jgi:undecaprenol kinase
MKIINSFKYAISGVAIAFSANLNLKIHLVLAVVAILLGLYLKLSHLELVLVTILIALVFSAEMINSAIEEVVDLLVSEHKVQAKIAKDVSAGMVLVVSIGALVCGIIIFLPYLIK